MRFGLLALCLAATLAPPERAMAEDSVSSPEFIALTSLIESKEIWKLLGGQAGWGEHGVSYAVEDMDDLSVLDKYTEKTEQLMAESHKSIIGIAKRNGVIHYANWRFRTDRIRPGSPALFTLRVQVYADEESLQKEIEAEKELAEFGGGKSFKRGERQFVESTPGLGFVGYEGRVSISARPRPKTAKLDLKIVNAALTEWKKQLAAAEKAAKKERKKREREAKKKEKKKEKKEEDSTSLRSAAARTARDPLPRGMRADPSRSGSLPLRTAEISARCSARSSSSDRGSA